MSILLTNRDFRIRNMKKQILMVSCLATMVACTSAGAPADDDVSVTIHNATYSVRAGATLATLNFDLIVRNNSDESAKPGCDVSVERDQGTGFQQVPGGEPACIGPALFGPTIGPHKADTLEITKAIPLIAIDESAKYRVLPLVALGPEFRMALPFASNSFSITKKN